MFKKKLFRLGMALICVFSVLFLVNALSFADELGDIQAAIKAKGVKWNAEKTSVSRLSPEERKMRLGLILHAPAPEEEALTNQEAVSSGLTSLSGGSLDWRTYAGNLSIPPGNYVTPVKDQGNCGSCWAFATTAALESYALLHSLNSYPLDDLSEQVLISCGRSGSCRGGYIDSASDFIHNTGLPSESCYPYMASNGKCKNACLNWGQNAYKIANWAWVATTTPTVDAIKSALNTYGPLVTTMNVYTDFFYYKSGVYQYASGKYQGGHAILIVGYDDSGSPPYFIVKNSWGTGWGDSGYFKIAQSELSSKVLFGQWTIAYKLL